jgi:hypothetical protein
VGARGIERAQTSNHPDGSEYTDLAPSKVKIMLKSSGAMAVARYQGKRGEEFWGGVSDPDGLRSADPRKVYREYLFSQPRKGTELVTAKAAALAWNHFYEGNSVTKIVVQNAPVVILGTPFSPGRNR